MSNEIKFCQSCGMPLTADVLGTNADGEIRSHVKQSFGLLQPVVCVL